MGQHLGDCHGKKPEKTIPKIASRLVNYPEMVPSGYD